MTGDDRIGAEIGRAVAEDRATAIMPGCADMTVPAQAPAKSVVPVPEGVSCAVGLAEKMVRPGLPT